MNKLTYFYAKKDQNKTLFAFNNGVYDLNIMQFREGRPEDWNSLSVGYHYQEIPETDITYQQVTKFFE